VDFECSNINKKRGVEIIKPILLFQISSPSLVLVYVDDVNLLGDNIDAIKKHGNFN
jgi:hypothetical protein